MHAPPNISNHARRLAWWAVAAMPAAVLAVVVVARHAPVLERGYLLPFFDEYEVARAQLAGVELYVDTSSGVADLLTVCALALMAVILLAGAWSAGGDAALRRTFLAAGLGAAYLSGDDYFAVHETIGHNLGVLAELPIVDHPDDVIMGVYALIVCAFAWRHRSLLAGAPRGPWLAALVLAGLAVGHDLLPLHMSGLEEGLEVAAGLAMVWAVALVVRHRLPVAAPGRQSLRPQEAG